MSTNCTNELPPRSNELPARIGLCLSGGGFRAAAFHLGVLTYLDRVGLLDRVRVISTVSGGTFTGAKYALSCVEKTPPTTFFRQYYEELQNSDIFPNALRILANGQPLANSSGRKDIITCAAQSYCETFFRRRITDAPAMFGDLLTQDTAPLEEIIFNSTDFRAGLAFRFQRAKTGLIGNLKTQISKEDAAKLRIGDIVAASSCFPAGFEPLEFPHDFTWIGRETPPNVRSTPLMDGGVYDNQGLESLILSINRTKDETQGQVDTDMIIMSDTDRRADALYTIPQSVAKFVEKDESASPIWSWMAKWNPTLGTVAWVSWLLMVLCIASGVAVVSNLVVEGQQWWNKEPGAPSFTRLVLTNVFPLLLTGSAAFLLWFLRSLFKNQLLNQVPQLRAASWPLLSRVRLVSAIDMVVLRVSSLVALASNVFMKHIRAAGYRTLYNDPLYAGKLVANYIYSVHSKNAWAFKDPLNDDKMLKPMPGPRLLAEIGQIPTPSEVMQTVVDSAERVPTLLWFENGEQLPDLVAAGQIATCVNLMKFLVRTRNFDEQKGEFTDPEVQKTWTKLKNDWLEFRKDPHVLEKEIRPVPHK